MSPYRLRPESTDERAELRAFADDVRAPAVEALLWLVLSAYVAAQLSVLAWGGW